MNLESTTCYRGTPEACLLSNPFYSRRMNMATSWKTRSVFFLSLCFVIVINFCGHFINLIVGHNVSWFEIFPSFCRPSLPDIVPGKTVRPTCRFLLIWFYHSKSSTYTVSYAKCLISWKLQRNVCSLLILFKYKKYYCTYVSVYVLLSLIHADFSWTNNCIHTWWFSLLYFSKAYSTFCFMVMRILEENVQLS